MQVFLSYARSGAGLSASEVSRRRAQVGGLDVWLDEERLPPGHRLEAAIRQGVDTSDAAVFLISRLWVERDWTRWELTQFARREPRCERMLPVLRGATARNSNG